MRIHPTAWMFTPLVVASTANARIAPTAMSRMLTGIPMPPLCPNGVEKERAGDPAVAGVLLERLEAKAGADECRDDPPEAPEAVGEVVVVPALEAVDAERDRVRLVDEEFAARVERRDDPSRPGVEVAELPEGSLRRVDEVEAPAAKLGRQVLRLALDPEDLRPLLARVLEGVLRRLEGCHDRALLGELGARAAASGVQVEDALRAQIAERRLDDRRQPGCRLAAAPVQLVERAPVEIGGFHLREQGEAAIDHDRLTSDHGRVVGGEERHGGRDVFGQDEPAGRRAPRGREHLVLVREM